MNVAEPSEKMMAEIKRRVLLFCTDNPRFANHMPAIEAAMLIGATIAFEYAWPGPLDTGGSTPRAENSTQPPRAK
jgi:hypothetical protein